MPWEPLPGGTREPTSVRQALDVVMNRLSGTSLATIEVVRDAWPEIVGSDLASASTPVKIDAGRLVVRVEEAIWATEIRWLKGQIVERIAALSGGTTLSDVRVVVRGAKGHR